MRHLFIATLIVLTFVGQAVAQNYQGNWACRTPDARAGILTIFGQSYGYASLTNQDPASGTGSVTAFNDGVSFDDGPLRKALGIIHGRLVPHDQAGVAMQLETETTIILLCTPLR